MATLISALITNARLPLLEGTASFWTDAELLTHANEAIKDLWASIIDLYQDHFVTQDVTHCALAANATTVTGVPADVFRVVMLQPRVLGQSSSTQGLVFKPSTLLDPRFVQAQAQPAITPRADIVYYCVLNAGAPVAAPAIITAPALSAAVNLTLWYIPTIAAKIASDANPIPGESDKAVQEYIIAFARAKEREDRSPDPEHLSIYATEKRKMLTALTPRSVQEPQVVDAMWELLDTVSGG